MEVIIRIANGVVTKHHVIDFSGCRFRLLLDKFQLATSKMYCSCINDMLKKIVTVLFLWGNPQPISTETLTSNFWQVCASHV